MNQNSQNKRIIKSNLSTLLKKFSKSDVILDMEKEYQSASVMMLDVSLIDDSPFLKKARIPDRILKQIASSISATGLRTPLLVRPKKDHYEIVLGRKRLLAAKSNKIPKLPAVLQNVSDEEMLLMLLAELRDRKDRNVVELALVCQKLTKDFGFTQQSLATLTRQSRSQITNLIRILNLPDYVLTDISIGKLSYGHAKSIVALPDSFINEIIPRIYKENLSVHQVESIVYQYRNNINNDLIIEKLSKKYDCEVMIKKNIVSFDFNDIKSRDEFISLINKKEKTNVTKRTKKR